MATEIFQQITEKFTTSLIKKFLGKLEQSITHAISNRLVEYQVEEAQHCLELISILYKEPVKLVEIYYPVSLENNEDNKFIIATEKVSNLFKGVNKISLFGTAGSGKTTFVKYLFIKSVQENFKVPILIYLRNIQFNFINLSKTGNLEYNAFFKKISDLFYFQNIASEDQVVDQLLSSGMFLFILDGFDELQEKDERKAIEDILEFTKRYNKNKFIITSRQYSGLENVTGFSRFSLSELETHEIGPFIKKQLFRKQTKAEEIIKVLNEDHSDKFKPYLRNPLFLILFINAFDTYPNLPKLVSKFYWQVFDALYEKHDNLSKTGFRRERVSMITREHFEDVLNEFSLISYFEDKFVFDEAYFINTINKIKNSRKLVLNSGDFLTELKNDLCLIVVDGLKLQFIHRSIQEYFGAKLFERFNEKERAKMFFNVAISESRHSKHSFFIKLLSEIYPNEYLKHFIPAYNKEFFDKHCDVFLNAYCNETQLRSFIYDFIIYRNFINYNDISKDIFDKRISENKAEYTFHKYLLDPKVRQSISFNLNLNQESLNTLILDVLSLHKMQAYFIESIEEVLKRESDKNVSIINLVFNNRNI